MANESEQVCRTFRWGPRRRVDNTASLGDVLSGLMENRISPQQERFGLITDAWSQLLPVELCRHCKIVEVSGGRLKVSVDSSAYMYEMQLLSSELLKELASMCPQAKIREIKFAVG
ncbi:MAG: DciA family protein [Phycisphaerae bacterium]|nr:DciA family protein [Phycisphaerae bacterium]